MNKAGLERNENIFRFTNAWFGSQVLARRPEVQVHGPIWLEGSPFIDKPGAIRMVAACPTRPSLVQTARLAPHEGTIEWRRPQ
jgi:hypothetical protein